MPDLLTVGEATLDAPAARAYARALAAGAPDSVTSSYRDPDAQLVLYTGWVRRLPGYNFALHPSKSDHCKGLAIDLRGVKAKAWFRVYGQGYGWLFTDGSEDWHIAYRIEHDRHLADVTTLAPITRKDWFDMATKEELRAVIREEVGRGAGGLLAHGPLDPNGKTADTWYVLDPATMTRRHLGPNALKRAQALGVPAVEGAQSPDFLRGFTLVKEG